MAMIEIETDSRQDDVVRFHVRHMICMVMLVIGLIITCLLLLNRQYSLSIGHQNELLLENFREHTTQLDNLLSRVTTRVDSMRIKAEFDLLENRQSGYPKPAGIFRQLKETPDGRGFHLDRIMPPYTRGMVGNLTGKGGLSGREPDFYREIQMALNLNPQFQASAQAIKDAAWIYYMSAGGFINIYPWVSSRDFSYADELLSHEFFTLGTPEKNPGRELFWTEVYIDEYGKGLMTTCAIPVYDQNRFVGTVAIDLTVDFLNSRVKHFQAASGTIFIVNDRRQLMAHPTLTTSSDKEIKLFSDVLVTLPGIEQETLQTLPENQIVHAGGYLILRARLNYAPWQVYLLIRSPSIWSSYVNAVGIGGFTLIFGMLVMVVTIFFYTHFRFILPSGKLVQFIMDQDKLPTPPLPAKMPAIWLPWLKKISQTFEDNERLAREIRQQNEILEKRVAERTLELLEANRQLQRESEERLEAEKEKQNLQGKLQHAQKMEAIGMLAGGVAHDLNNVLAGLVSYPQLLLMELEPDSPLRASIHTIQKSGERAAAIVQDLLTLARRGVTVTEVVCLNDLIRSYLATPEYRNLAFNHPSVDTELELADDLLKLKGSPVHLTKCIMNLLINAMEAMPDGGRIVIKTSNCYVDLPVSGYEEVAEGDYVLLQIVDSGVGIQAADIERIFEPFYTKKVMGRSGTGLGMAVVWGTVKDHRGYINVRSQIGVGTGFSLYFPATREQRQAEQAEIDLLNYRGWGEQILIVDDVAEQREVGTRMLQLLGYQVDSVASGEDAVRYVKEKRPDLLVLDMIMDPGMDGYETYKQITAIRPGQKAIIASGFSENERVRETLILGAGAYVRKPYLIERIAVAVRKELDRQR